MRAENSAMDLVGAAEGLPARKSRTKKKQPEAAFSVVAR
jgi:hypothetical protein